MIRRARWNERSGLTLLETMITISILAIVATAAMGTFGSGVASSRSVTSGVIENAELRESGRRLVDELSAAGGGRFEVNELPDQNHELIFQVPVTVGAVADWGVYDRKLGSEEADWNRADWSLRYTVVGDGNGGRRLVRQVLDDVDAVQRETTLAEDLNLGNANPPGFRVTDEGDVWEIVIGTEHARAVGGDAGGTRLHVRNRN